MRAVSKATDCTHGGYDLACSLHAIYPPWYVLTPGRAARNARERRMEEDTREQMGTDEETAEKARILHCSFIIYAYRTKHVRYACTGMSKGSLSLL